MTLRAISVLNWIKSVLFGEWNGLQVFLVPTSMLFLIDDSSLHMWFLGLFSRQLFYIPLVLFILLLLFLINLIIMQSVSLESMNLKPKQRNKWLYGYILGIHELLLVILFSFMVLYVLTAFLKYFYAIQLPLRYLYLKIFQYMAIGLILYVYLRNYWLRLVLKTDHSLKRNSAMLMIYIRHNRRTFILHTLFVLGMVVLSVHVFKWVVYLFLDPLASSLTDLMGIPIRFTVVKVRTTIDLLYNLYMLFCAFIVSNLLYAPFVKLFHVLASHFRPQPLQKV